MKVNAALFLAASATAVVFLATPTVGAPLNKLLDNLLCLNVNLANSGPAGQGSPCGGRSESSDDTDPIVPGKLTPGSPNSELEVIPNVPAELKPVKQPAGASQYLAKAPTAFMDNDDGNSTPSELNDNDEVFDIPELNAADEEPMSNLRDTDSMDNDGMSDSMVDHTMAAELAVKANLKDKPWTMSGASYQAKPAPVPASTSTSPRGQQQQQQ
ncbi:hypothetical protein BJ085DRAFT_37307, partial [Dimargaris cristalligena]